MENEQRIARMQSISNLARYIIDNENDIGRLKKQINKLNEKHERAELKLRQIKTVDLYFKVSDMESIKNCLISDYKNQIKKMEEENKGFKDKMLHLLNIDEADSN